MRARLNNQRGAILILFAILTPVLLSIAMWCCYIAYLTMVESELRAAADVASFTGISEACDHFTWSQSPCGNIYRWNRALDFSVKSLRLAVSHGSPGTEKHLPDQDVNVLFEPRSSPTPDTPHWQGSDYTIEIDRGYIDEQGTFHTLEGYSWSVEHPGVTKYILFSAMKVKISRTISGFWGALAKTISVESYGVVPNEKVLVAPFAVPLCALIPGAPVKSIGGADWSVLDFNLNASGSLVNSGDYGLCGRDLLLTGTSRNGTFETPGCDPATSSVCCPPGGCLAIPDFTWSAAGWGYYGSESDGLVSNVPPGLCNWGSTRVGKMPQDTASLVGNYGVVGLPFAPKIGKDGTPQLVGYYTDYDPIVRPTDIYRPEDVNEANIKDLLNNLRDNVPLVQARVGWSFKVLAAGLTGVNDSNGSRVEDAVWNQIDRMVPGNGNIQRCREDIDESVCRYQTYRSSQAAWIVPQSLAWQVEPTDSYNCADLPTATRGVCRSRRAPDVISSNGVCKSEVSMTSTQQALLSASTWRALVPVIADVRRDSSAENPCNHPMIADNMTIVGFLGAILYDVDINNDLNNNGIYSRPLNGCKTSCKMGANFKVQPECEHYDFRDRAEVDADQKLPVWGFNSPDKSQTCNVVRAMFECFPTVTGSTALATRPYFAHLGEAQ